MRAENPRRLSVAVVGGGPAGLMAAETAASGGASVTLYDAMPSLGRKLLMAGRSGLNLTHAEPFEAFLSRYGPAAPHLRAALAAFPPEALRLWADGLGAETFVGSSGRVFPKAWKASPLLRAWLRRLDGLGVAIALRHRWTGWSETGDLLFETPAGPAAAPKPDATILALGGASWPRLGSDGGWVPILKAAGIAPAPLRASNVAVRIAWSVPFLARFEGAPLKRIAVALGGETRRGEAVVTAQGLEGGPVYALSGPIRRALEAGEARLAIDLRPDLPGATLAAALSRPRAKQSTSTWLRKAAGLPPIAIALLREAAGRDLPADPAALAPLVKAVPLHITGTAGIERAISSAGGVPLDAVDAHFMLRARPGTFVAGEMLDWDAPTGGYLLQACFATGVAAAHGASAWAGGTSGAAPVVREPPCNA